MIKRFLALFLGMTAIVLIGAVAFSPVKAQSTDLWQVYDTTLKSAKYVDLTHAFSPTIPVWPGFGHATFHSTSAGADIPDYIKLGEEYTYPALFMRDGRRQTNEPRLTKICANQEQAIEQVKKQ